MPSLSDFVHTQFLLRIPQPSVSFAGKTVIVTGGNGGLGKQIVTYFVRLGAAKVILACRSQARGDKAKAEIESITKCRLDVIDVMEVDIESPSSISTFVDEVNELDRVDVFVNNAGMRTAKHQLVYGTERTLGVNMIGTFLLALQIIPLMKSTAKRYKTTPVMTFVASALYDVAKYPENPGDDIFAWYAEESHMNHMNQYNLSKLLQIYGAIKLCQILDPENTEDPNPIVINSVDPSFCKTGLSGELSGVAKGAFKVFEAIAANSAEEGSRLVVQAAAAGRETHGLYLRAGKVQKYAPIALDEERTTHVWETLSKRLEKVQPGIMRNIE
ncbi:NAD(P)-binding protein [Aspergillus ellipticus CBS 707.79]|uniref:NAD(P)-binding protein n=1 Tax=Aspergillus ellipticus CBS 707.79 TaxID=1448320 RepID=A0A319DAM9_9EURO|nr:NAD(P)-binding protein [Aspergillus ellipticus CBS 707.79]